MKTTHKIGRITLRALAALAFAIGVLDLISKQWAVGACGILGWIIINIARDRIFPDIKELNETDSNG